MHFITDQEDSTTIFRLKEQRLDSRNAGQLKAEFLILAQPDIKTLIVDLTDVEYIDSAGISALLLAQRQMRIHDGELRLVGLNENVRSMLAVTQLDRIFPIFDSVQDARRQPAASLFFSSPDFDVMGVEEEDAVILADEPLGPEAPTTKAIRSGAIAAGGSFGAAALANIMMTPFDDELEQHELLAFGDDEDDYDEEEDDLDEFDDDFDDEETDDDDLDEEDDVEEVEEAGDEEVEPADEVIEDEDFEDDDWDDEELEEDEEEDY